MVPAALPSWRLLWAPACPALMLPSWALHSAFPSGLLLLPVTPSFHLARPLHFQIGPDIPQWLRLYPWGALVEQVMQPPPQRSLPFAVSDSLVVRWLLVHRGSPVVRSGRNPAGRPLCPADESPGTALSLVCPVQCRQPLQECEPQPVLAHALHRR